MRSFNLNQLIQESTRITDSSNTLIDLILVNNEHRFVKSGVLSLPISDHSLVYCVLKVGVPKAIPKTIEYRSFKTYNQDNYIEDLKSVPWHVIDNEENIDDAVLTWNKLFLDIVDSHAPITKRRITGSNQPWMNPKLCELMRKRDFHHQKARKSDTSSHWKLYRKYRNLVNTQIKASKSEYYINLIQESKGAPN